MALPQERNESSSSAPKAASLARLLPPWVWRTLLYALLVPAVAVVLLQMLLPRSLDRVNPHWPSKFWKPIILNPQAYLPKINRDLFAVSVQPYRAEPLDLTKQSQFQSRSQTRLWIGGEQGYLAFTADNGLNWDCLTFEAGRFDNQHACQGAGEAGLGLAALPRGWSAGLPAGLPSAPTVYAAQATPSKPTNQSPFQAAPSKLSPRSANQSPNQFLGESREKSASPINPRLLNMSANIHDFGTVQVGQFKPFEIKLSALDNTFRADLSSFKFPDSSVSRAPFKLTGAPCSRVEFGASCTLELLFEPPAPGIFSTDLTFVVSPIDTSQAAATSSKSESQVYTIHLRGEGVDSRIASPSIVTPGATPSTTSAQPRSTTPQTIASPGDIVSISWQTPQQGQLVMAQAGPSRLFVTDNGGQTWTSFQPASTQPANSEQEAVRRALRLEDPCTVIFGALSYRDQISYVKDYGDYLGERGRACRFTVNTKETQVNALASRGEKQIWAVGGTHGAGAVTRIDPKNLYEHETIPLTWAATDRSWRFGMELPAPWFWAAILLAGFFLWGARQGPVESPAPGIDNTAVSDRPLQPDDLDSMRLRAVADGISRFFRNPNTSAPLVLCIKGGWGSGKSSLMNLLADDLRHSVGQKHRVIAFNAWHHQTEEQVLASLLQSIRVNALKAPWTPSGAWYRLRIFIKRWPQRWFVSVAFCLSTLWTCYVVKGLLEGGETAGATSLDGVKLLTSIPAVLTAFVTFRQLMLGFTGFLSNPAALLASDAKGGSTRQLEAQTTVRQSFAADFKTVTEVLGNGRLVILIDDLDRCQPEKIRDIIEAINFLVTAGDCYIVLGMARDLVEHYLGHSFEKSIETMPAALLGLSEEKVKDAPTREAAFARLYLEKMIQLQFNLRSLGAEQAIALFENSSTARRSETATLGKRTAEDPGKLDPGQSEAETRKLLQTERGIRNVLRGVERWFMPAMGSVLLVIAGVRYLPGTAAVFDVKVKPYLHSSPPPAPVTVVCANQGAVGTSSGASAGVAKSVPPAGATVRAEARAAAGGAASIPTAVPVTIGGDAEAGIATTAAGSTSDGSTSKAFSSATALVLPLHDPEEIVLPADAMLVSASSPGKLQILLVCTGLVLALWFAGRWWLVSIPEVDSAKDSQSFMTALRIWAPFLLSMCKTPRGLKQFLNRVRFLAMLQRAEIQPAAPGAQQTALRRVAMLWVVRRDDQLRQRIEENLAARARGKFGADQLIPDSLLVALAAIEARPGLYLATMQAAKYDREWLGNLDHDQKLLLDKDQWLMFQQAFASIAKAEFGDDLRRLAEALQKHRSAFCSLNGGVDKDQPVPVET